MSKKVFFSGLNELRAIAALSVLFHHVELYKKRDNGPSLYNFDFFNSFIDRLGVNAVYLFFTLSGFLITYLLLVEKERTNTIQIREFYIRRVLRIWPLYFIILLIGFFVIPGLLHLLPDFFQHQTYYNQSILKVEYGLGLFLYLIFLSSAWKYPVPGASQSWSVSVEEQFYLIWPWIVKYASKHLYWILPLIVIGMNIIFKLSSRLDNELLSTFLRHFRIDFMAIGGIFALLFKNRTSLFEKYLTNNLIALAVFIALFVQLFFYISNILLGFTFGCLIILMIVKKIHIPIFDYLGKWSYGIYMYHPFIMWISFATVSHFFTNHSILGQIMQYVLVLAGTIGISYLSYKYIEIPFLRKKEKFSAVSSGNL